MTCGVSDVADFYAGKSVFITGGTGFLGKALIEKLLYSCNKVDKIYVLVRGKKGVPAEQRINDITENGGFFRIKERDPKDLKKIVPVTGNLEEENLGVSNDDLETLIKNVSIVFHVAATVRFDEPLKTAVNININGTDNMIKVCHRMENLEALVHVSTMYNNTDRKEVLEQVYPAPDSVQHVRYMADRYSDHEGIVKILLGSRPNTYTYTKSVAEELVKDLHGDIPTVIVRPSIVTAAHSEPCPGWVDGWNGPTRILAGAKAGVIRVLYGNKTGVADFIPVDFVTNFMIVAGTKCERSSEVKVFNCCSSNTNPTIWQDQIGHVISTTKKHGFNTLPFPFAFYLTNKFLYKLSVFFLQILPAWCLDHWALMTGTKSRYMVLQNKIQKLMDTISYFMENEWTFRDTNFRSTLKSLSPGDRVTFNFDVKTINWKTYFSNYVVGIHKYLMEPKQDVVTKKSV